MTSCHEPICPFRTLPVLGNFATMFEARGQGKTVVDNGIHFPVDSSCNTVPVRFEQRREANRTKPRHAK